MTRTTIIAVLTVIVLVGVLFAVNMTGDLEEDMRTLSIPGVKLDDKKPEKEEGKEADEVPEEERPTVGPADKVVFARLGTEVTLVKEGEDSWRITSPFNSMAENYKVRSMLRTFDKPLSSNYSRAISAEALSKLGLDEGSRIRVSLFQGDAKLVDLIVGRVDKKEMGEDPDTMVMLPEEEEVVYYRIPGKDLRRAFDIELDELRNKKIFDFRKEDVLRVSIEDPRTTPPTKLVFEKSTGESQEGKEEWRVVTPAGMEMDNVGGFASSFANVRADSFLDKLPGADASALDKAYKITAAVKKGDKEENHTLYFGAGRKKGIYARVEGRDGVFVVGKHTADNLMKSANDFRKKKLYTFKPADIQELELVRAGMPRLHLKKSGEEWSFVEPTGEFASNSKVKSMASSIANFRVAEFVDEDPGAETTGLDNPELKVTVRLLEAAGSGSATLLVGKDFKNAEDQERFYARQEGNTQIFSIMKYSRENIAKTLDDLKDQRVFRVDKDDIIEVTLKHPDQTLTFVREEKGGKKLWNMTSPKEKKDVSLTPLVSALANLDVEKLDAGKSPKEAGLEGDAFTINFKTAAGKEHSITISEEVEDNKNFALTSTVDHLQGKVFMVSKYKAQNLAKKLPDFEKKKGPPGGPGGMPPGMPMMPNMPPR